jgi:hypothetical protein
MIARRLPSDGRLFRSVWEEPLTYTTAILTVIAVAAAVGLASMMVSRAISLETRRRHHEVGSQVFQLIGVMFSVVLAFVFSEVWSQYITAAQAIDRECGALHGASLLADAMPKGQGRAVNEQIVAYTKTVIEEEWPAMQARQGRPAAVQALRAAIDAAARTPAETPSEVASRTQIVTLLSQAHEARETRTFQLTLGVPKAMWAVLIVIASMLIGMVVVAGTEPPATVILASAFAASIVMVLILVRMLDYPFEGALALSDEDFVRLQAEVVAMLAGR